jgi:hypothetical protein
MKTPIIEGFSQAGLQSYLKGRQYSGLYWPSMFPVKNVNSLDGKTIIGDQGSRVAAYVTSYDSKAPEVSRKTLTTQYFDIPKISIARRKSEKEILEHYISKSLTGNNAVLEDYFNDIDFVYDAALARQEWFALQAASLTKFQLSTTNNPLGIINEVAIDFGMPTANKKVVTTATWSVANAATMLPITDFKKILKAGRDMGVDLKYAVMNADMFDIVVGSTEFQNSAKSLIAGQATVLGMVGIETANLILKSLGLPTIVVINTSVGIENAAGTISYSNPWDTNHVLFVPELSLGNMYSGPIAEELERPEGVWQAKRGNVLVSIQKEWNPSAVVTKAESNSFPSWPTVDKCINLYTNHTSTWA